jgi:hypothetical protein
MSVHFNPEVTLPPYTHIEITPTNTNLSNLIDNTVTFFQLHIWYISILIEGEREFVNSLK